MHHTTTACDVVVCWYFYGFVVFCFVCCLLRLEAKLTAEREQLEEERRNLHDTYDKQQEVNHTHLLHMHTHILLHSEVVLTGIDAGTCTLVLLLIARTNFSEFSDDWHNR